MDRASVQGWPSQPETHETWVRTLYGGDAARFHDLAIDRLLDVVPPVHGSLFLDAGCGDCARSILLARRGFRVHAIDLSGRALEMARASVAKQHLASQIVVEAGDLTGLHRKDGSFDHVVCWRVRMHIPPPGLERAIHELARVLRNGGMHVVSEINLMSVDSVLHRTLARLVRRGRTEVRQTPAGVEYWSRTSGGSGYLREDNQGWLTSQFERQGLEPQARISGEFTEAWVVLRPPARRRLIFRFNWFWFRSVRSPRLARGNFHVFRQSVASGS